jgi:aminoglycoside phosphotransferase (APT) family kinase protein
MPTTPLLQQADERVRSHGVPAAASVFLHDDVWGGNMLWEDDRCVALIDWKTAGVGDPAVDLGSLRMQMALQYGQDVSASTTPLGGGRSSIRSSPGRSWRRSPLRSDPGTGR